MNRRARYDYTLEDNLTVGMILTGPEVRAIRDHHAQLKGTYVNIRNGELFLLNLTLKSDTARDIKLLATRRQIAALTSTKTAGSTIVPTLLLPAGRHIKLEIAVGRGKKKYDKRETIKKRDLEREQR